MPLGIFGPKSPAGINNAQEIPMGDLGPNLPKGTCDGALQFKVKKENFMSFQGRQRI